MSKKFYDYFSENMKALNLPAPESLFGTLTAATASIGSMVKFVQNYGTRTTVAEMIITLPGAVAGAGGGVVGFATAASEGLLVVGALSAAYYVGACIGSLAVATGRSFSGGLSIADCLSTAALHGIETPQWLQDTLSTNIALCWTSGGANGPHPTWVA
jgi:hypothetical protein